MQRADYSNPGNLTPNKKQHTRTHATDDNKMHLYISHISHVSQTLNEYAQNTKNEPVTDSSYWLFTDTFAQPNQHLTGCNRHTNSTQQQQATNKNKHPKTSSTPSYLAQLLDSRKSGTGYYWIGCASRPHHLYRSMSLQNHPLPNKIGMVPWLSSQSPYENKSGLLSLPCSIISSFAFRASRVPGSRRGCGFVFAIKLDDKSTANLSMPRQMAKYRQ